MSQIVSKSALAVALSRLKGFTAPQARLEQYKTDPEIAADMLWKAHMQGDLAGKKIADFGSGTGILGIGALMLGASEVIMIESDSEALAICRENEESARSQYGYSGKVRLLEADIKDFSESCDLVIQNPPFGTKVKHADKAFLEHAMGCAKVIYSLHKSTSRAFLEAISRDYGFSAREIGKYTYPLPATMSFHTKKRAFIEVSLWRLQK